MPTPYESAQLNIQLFELRREPVLREARAWFLRDFNPESLQELIALLGGERNASFRMVLGYWDFAASLVTTGAIDGDAFRAAHGEVFGTFAVVMADPDADAILKRRRDRLRAMAKARAGTAPSSSEASASNPR